MAIETFGELQAAVSNWLERSDLSDRIPEFITLAESDHRREIRIRGMLTRACATTTAGSRYLALPDGYLGMKGLRLLTTPVTRVSQMSWDEMTDDYYDTNNGRPVFFAVHEEIEFNAPPDSAYIAEMVYYKELDVLSATTATNALLTDHPDAYLYGALTAAEPFLQDDERLQLWMGLYEKVKVSISDAFVKDQWSHGPLRKRPSLKRVY